MPKTQQVNQQKIQKQKQIIGAIAIILLIIITTLALVYRINFIVWVILDLIVAGVANLLLKRIGRTPI
jgi:hypothetical protein